MNIVNMEAQVFTLPNYLTIRNAGGTIENRIDVGDIPVEQAEAYWDWCKQHWLAHVQRRANYIKMIKKND